MQRHREPIKCTPLVCLQYFRSLKCAHIYFFAKKVNQSILGNLSCKLCRASRGGASLHKYNFFCLYTHLHFKEKQVISVCLQALVQSWWCGQKVIFIPFKIFKLLLQLSTARSLYLCATSVFLFTKNWKQKY
jgi:hypothetical protein